MINKYLRKSLARKNGNEILIWSWNNLMLIFAVWLRKPIHTWLPIPTYHHWNCVVCNSPSYRVFKSWLQVDQTCVNQCQHRCYIEEPKQLNHKLPTRWVAKARDWEISSLIENLHLLPPLGGWLSYFGVLYIYAWHYCRKYCIQQIKHDITAENTI